MVAGILQIADHQLTSHETKFCDRRFLFGDELFPLRYFGMTDVGLHHAIIGRVVVGVNIDVVANHVNHIVSIGVVAGHFDESGLRVLQIFHKQAIA